MGFQWQLICGIISIIYIITTFPQKPKLFRNDKIGHYILLFLILCIISKAATGWIGGTLDFFLSFLPSIVVYFLIILTNTSISKCHSFLVLVSVLACFLCLHEIIQITTGTGFGGLPPMPREPFGVQACWYGVFNDPNDLGLALVSIAPYILYRSMPYNPVFISFFGLIFTGVYFTDSRGTIVSFIAGIGIYFVFKKRNFKGLIIAGLFALVLLMFGPSRVSEINTTETSSHGRIEAWFQGFKMMSHHPILGVGPNNFTEHHFITAHNSYVLAAAETGIFGFILFNGIIFIPIYIGGRIIFLEKNEESINFLSALLGCAVAGCVSINFLSRTYIMVPYMNIAVLSAACRSCCPDIYIQEINRISIYHLILLSFLMFFILLRGHVSFPMTIKNSFRDIREDAVKGILILLIVLEHNHKLTDQFPSIHPLADSFVVGAFLLLIFGRPVSSLPFISYINKHFRYIVPFLIIGFFLSSANWVIHRPEPLSQFFQTLFMCLSVQSVFFIKKSTGFMLYWFLPCLCFLHLLRYMQKTIGKPFLFLMLILHLIIGVFDEDVLIQLPLSCHPAIFLFFIGWIYGEAKDKILSYQYTKYISSLIFFSLIYINHKIPYALFLAPGVIPNITKVHLLAYYDMLMISSIFGLYSIFIFLPDFALTFFSYIGRNSFWIFIYHQPVFIFITEIIKFEIPGFQSYLLTLTISCMLSYISNHFTTIRDILFPKTVSSFYFSFISTTNFLFKLFKIT